MKYQVFVCYECWQALRTFCECPAKAAPILDKKEKDRENGVQSGVLEQDEEGLHLAPIASKTLLEYTASTCSNISPSPSPSPSPSASASFLISSILLPSPTTSTSPTKCQELEESEDAVEVEWEPTLNHNNNDHNTDQEEEGTVLDPTSIAFRPFESSSATRTPTTTAPLELQHGDVVKASSLPRLLTHDSASFSAPAAVIIPNVPSKISISPSPSKEIDPTSAIEILQKDEGMEEISQEIQLVGGSRDLVFQKSSITPEISRDDGRGKELVASDLGLEVEVGFPEGDREPEEGRIEALIGSTPDNRLNNFPASIPIAPKSTLKLQFHTSYRTPPTPPHSQRSKASTKTRSSRSPSKSKSKSKAISIIPGASLAKKLGLPSIYVPSPTPRTSTGITKRASRILALKKSSIVGEGEKKIRTKEKRKERRERLQSNEGGEQEMSIPESDARVVEEVGGGKEIDDGRMEDSITELVAQFSLSLAIRPSMNPPALPFALESRLPDFTLDPLRLKHVFPSREDLLEHPISPPSSTHTLQFDSIDKNGRGRVEGNLAITTETVGDSAICGLTDKEEAILEALKAIEVDRSPPSKAALPPFSSLPRQESSVVEATLGGNVPVDPEIESLLDETHEPKTEGGGMKDEGISGGDQDLTDDQELSEDSERSTVNLCPIQEVPASPPAEATSTEINLIPSFPLIPTLAASTILRRQPTRIVPGDSLMNRMMRSALPPSTSLARVEEVRAVEVGQSLESVASDSNAVDSEVVKAAENSPDTKVSDSSMRSPSPITAVTPLPLATPTRLRPRLPGYELPIGGVSRNTASSSSDSFAPLDITSTPPPSTECTSLNGSKVDSAPSSRDIPTPAASTILRRQPTRIIPGASLMNRMMRSASFPSTCSARVAEVGAVEVGQGLESFSSDSSAVGIVVEAAENSQDTEDSDSSMRSASPIPAITPLPLTTPPRLRSRLPRHNLPIGEVNRNTASPSADNFELLDINSTPPPSTEYTSTNSTEVDSAPSSQDIPTPAASTTLLRRQPTRIVPGDSMMKRMMRLASPPSTCSARVAEVGAVEVDQGLKSVGSDSIAVDIVVKAAEICQDTGDGDSLMRSPSPIPAVTPLPLTTPPRLRSRLPRHNLPIGEVSRKIASPSLHNPAPLDITSTPPPATPGSAPSDKQSPASIPATAEATSNSTELEDDSHAFEPIGQEFQEIVKAGNKSATDIRTSTDSAGTTIMFNLDLVALSQDTTIRQNFPPLESFTEEPSGPKPREKKKPVDPEDLHQISRFSSFTPSRILTRSLMRKRQLKESYREIEGFKARKSARIFESKSRDIAKDTKPIMGMRAGIAGVPLKIKLFEEKYRSDVPKLGFEDLPVHIPRAEPTSTPLHTLDSCPQSTLSSGPYDKSLLSPGSVTRTGLRSGKAEQREAETTREADSREVEIEEAKKEEAEAEEAKDAAKEEAVKEEAAREAAREVAEKAETGRRGSVERNLISLVPSLANFKFSHRNGDSTSTSYIDKCRRSFATRTECPAGMSGAATELKDAIAKATNGRNALGESYRRKGRVPRGEHEVRQVGVHRELGSDVGYSKDFRDKIKKWVPLFASTGMTRVRNHISRCLETHYPKLYKSHESLALALAKVDLHFLFGAFASVCINSGDQVECKPHRDDHNLGPGLCAVYPYGDFDSSRSGWVILWEAGVVIEVGAGDLLLFPSAVFTHSNTPIHPDDKRNSLAAWVGASLFLWEASGSMSFNKLPKAEQKKRYAASSKNWDQAWVNFPTKSKGILP